MCVSLGYTFSRLMQNIHQREVCELCIESCFHWIKLKACFHWSKGVEKRETCAKCILTGAGVSHVVQCQSLASKTIELWSWREIEGKFGGF